jgi:3-hydroxyacyl-CoA dehydrogenase
LKSTPSPARSRKSKPGPAPAQIPAAVIGLGLMGTSIIACLLAGGHSVVGLTRNLARHKNARRHVLDLLRQMRRERLLKAEPAAIMKHFKISDNFDDLRDRGIVIESVIEDFELKKAYLRHVEEVVTPDTLIGSNTSSFPVTMLQAGAVHPERILGIHWAEPAHITRFMEITCGDRTDPVNAERVAKIARYWGKEPTVVRRDIRGFITNRIMYAMLREAFYLVEHGYASVADVDRSVRNDIGWWITLAGPFRFMDLTGIPAYKAVMEGLLPELCNSVDVPKLMAEVTGSGATGVANARGFYPYTPAQAKRWEKVFLEFTYEIRKLALKYPEDVAD